MNRGADDTQTGFMISFYMVQLIVYKSIAFADFTTPKFSYDFVPIRDRNTGSRNMVGRTLEIRTSAIFADSTLSLQHKEDHQNKP